MNSTINGSYNLGLIVLSFAIASLASYTALDLSGRVKTAWGRSRLLWLLGGAMAMGTGIWSMHFVAMLAFSLPLSVNYDVLTIILSLIDGMIASAIALWLLSHPNYNLLLLVIGGICMGIAIAWMHYTGMAAIRLQAKIEYDLWLVGLSVAIAIGASLIALWLSFYFQKDNTSAANWQKISSALIMGIAISGMHYTGMEATSFIPQLVSPFVPAPEIKPTLLAWLIGIAALFLLTTTILSSLCTAQSIQAQALKESEKRFRLLIREMQVGVLLLNVRAEILVANQAAQTLLSLSSDKNLVFGTHWQHWREDNTRLSVNELPVQQAIASRQPVRNVVIKIEPINFDGTTEPATSQQRWLLVNAEPYLSENGNVEQVICTLSEITKQKQAEAELKVAKEKADAANLAKSEFLAHMSHELRTPLNAILGFTQLMSHDMLFSKEHQQYLNIINRSGEHLLGLINDILEMSKIEAGRISLNLVQFDLYYLLDSLENMLRFKAENKGLQLIFRLDSQLPRYVETDERKLRQVLINLLNNAIKFTEEGMVTLTVANQESDGYYRLNFEVEDTGTGIAPEEVATLFEPFVQTKIGRNSQPGTGLGLAITRKFVQLMGGEISVSSKPGSGAKFSCTIQANPVRNSPKPKTQTVSRQVIGLAHGQTTYRLLVVEDNVNNSLLLFKLLTSIGFEVRKAKNGQEAVDLWSSWQPQLIWMDLKMPVMDGYEATKCIRAEEKKRQADMSNSRTKIIALTASVFEQDRQAVLAAGCDDFVRKPFREEELLEKINEHLGVQYLYESRNDSNQTEIPTSFSAGACLESLLTIMPSDWIKQMYYAAVQGSDALILELIEEIPLEHAAIAQALNELVEQFEFEQIMELTESIGGEEQES